MTMREGVISVDALLRGAVHEFKIEGNDYYIEYDIMQEQYDVNIFVVTEDSTGRVWEIEGCPAAFDYVMDNNIVNVGPLFNTPIAKQHKNQINYYDK